MIAFINLLVLYRFRQSILGMKGSGDVHSTELALQSFRYPGCCLYCVSEYWVLSVVLNYRLHPDEPCLRC